MLENKIHTFESPDKTAEAVAQVISDKINAKNDFFYLAVSGGNTPKILFEILAEKYLKKIDWTKLKIFWVDERCVSPENEDSNYKMTKEALLDHVPIPEKNIFRMKGEEIPQEEALRYQKMLENEIPTKYHLPYFDLILLGMGDDGHTASIFPDNLSLLNTKEIVVVAAHPSSGQKRITLTGNVIRNAKEILFLMTEKSKSKVLKAILTQHNAEIFPAYHILSQTDAEIYADNDAANLFSESH